jgi:hypothetical protein
LVHLFLERARRQALAQRREALRLERHKIARWQSRDSAAGAGRGGTAQHGHWHEIAKRHDVRRRAAEMQRVLIGKCLPQLNRPDRGEACAAPAKAYATWDPAETTSLCLARTRLSHQTRPRQRVKPNLRKQITDVGDHHVPVNHASFLYLNETKMGCRVVTRCCEDCWGDFPEMRSPVQPPDQLVEVCSA